MLVSGVIITWKMDDKEGGGFARNQAYRSLRSLTKFYTGREKNQVSKV